MNPSHDIAVRCARNRLIDLLGLGDSHPLTDLPVTVEPPKVPFGDSAQVLVHDAQADVRYQLLAPDDRPLGQADGPGAPLRIATPAVLENTTYRVRAFKTRAVPGLPAMAPSLLALPASVKVGLDTGLLVRFQEAPGLDALDPGPAAPLPSAPRLVDHGSQWLVAIERSQEGVDYALKLNGQPGQAQRRGDRQTITLTTGPVHEDTRIQVQATKHFALADRDTEQQDLLGELVLKVRPDPACPVRIAGPALVDHGASGRLEIGPTQASARYRVWVRPITDADFVHVPGPDDSVAAVPVTDRSDLRVRAPLPGEGAAPPEGFEPLPGPALPGTGGLVQVPLPAGQRDSLLIVQAEKQHAPVPGPDPQAPAPAGRTSARWLRQAAVLLVRPDPRPALQLRLDVAGGLSGDTLQLGGGQPGVYYHVHPLPDGAAGPWPAYVHQRDAADPGQNKGVGQLAVEVDFSLAASPEGAPAADDPARRPPPDPTLPLAPLAVGSRLAIRAVKAQTGADTALAEEALIAPVPAARLVPPVIDFDAPAEVLVPGPDPLDRFVLLHQGQALDAAPRQTDAGLVLQAGRWRSDTQLTLEAWRGADGGLQVVRRVTLLLPVRPDVGLVLSAAANPVPPGGGTDILVQAPQPGVDYQLMAAGQPVGAPVAGQGELIRLPTGPLAAATRFSVRATRQDRPDLRVTLQARVQVRLEAG